MTSSSGSRRRSHRSSTVGSSVATILERRGVAWFRLRIRRWFREHARSFPWRDTSDPYSILIAELMLQQTSARKVVPVYQAFLGRYPTAEALAGADELDIKSMIMPLGLQRRAARLIALALALVETHAGTVPRHERALLALPGVGPYTAGAVRSFAYGNRAAIPDTNVVRVLRRFFGLGEPTAPPPSTVPRHLRVAALELVPRAGARDFNLAILDFAALVCTHYAPACSTCPVNERCR